MSSKKAHRQASKYNVKWVEDESVDACQNCEKAFSTFRRKHHCRVGPWRHALCALLADGRAPAVRQGVLF